MKLKHLVLSALAAVGLAFTSQAAFDLSRFVPEGLDPAPTLDEKGECTYSYVDANGVKHYVTIFASTGNHTWTVPTDKDISKIDYLVVGGGGSGGYGSLGGGGGGAGGLLTGTKTLADLSVAAGDSLAVKVGAGATPSSGASGARNGSPSSIGEELVAQGGGAGGCGSGTRTGGAAGGSGGGAGGGSASDVKATGILAGGAAEPLQGNEGGSVSATKSVAIGGGGGGGAGGPGESKTSGATGGKGGDGVTCDITGKDVGYAAGGGGAKSGEGGYANGEKIGGTGSNSSNYGGHGVDGTGSGGGGRLRAKPASGDYAKGGDGIVVINYVQSFSVAFSWNADKVAFTAMCDDADISKGASVDDGSTIVMTATPYAGYSYEGVALDGWELDEESGAITKTIVVCEAIDVMVPEPEQTGPVVTLVEVTLAEIANAELTAEVDGVAVLSGNKVPENSIVFAKVAPAEHYEYTTAPAGWDFSEGGAITNYITAATDPTVITVAAPSAIMLKVNYPAFGTGTVVIRNGEDVVQDGASVLEGTELTVTVTPAEGYEYDVEPEGWTKVGNAITKAFTITEEFTPTIPEMKPIPRYTLTLDEVTNGSIAVEGGLATDYLRGTQVTLTASAATGYVLGYWTGAAAGKDASVTVTMDADKTVGAVFRSAEVDAVLSQYNHGNNLVAMWDCQDAGGISTNGWKDTMGRYTFYWNDPEKVNLPTGNALGISFGENGWGQMSRTEGETIFRGDNKVASQGVMEFVIKDAPKEDQSIFERYSNNIICRYCGGDDQPYVFGKEGNGIYYKVDAAFGEGTHTIVLSYGSNAKWIEAETYLDGVAGTVRTDKASYSIGGFNGWGAYLGRAAGSETTANSPFKGKILAVRFYKAHLTAEQAAANAALDQKRFGKKAGLILLIN